MSLERFICPDKVETKIVDCMAHCRMGERCMVRPLLALIGQEREWKGVASTTQLIAGTMETYLKIKESYATDPDGRLFMVGGTQHHKSLEEASKLLNVASEVALSGDRDIFDLLEVEDGKIGLTDYKWWGSFRVAKALGITKVGMKPNPDGSVYKTTSKWGKAGEPKMVPVFNQVQENVDNWETDYQLNRYRVKLFQLAGIKVDWMQLQVMVRDGGLAIAAGRGVVKNSYLIPVKFIEDEVVLKFFEHKDLALHQALECGWDIPCDPVECWDGRKCEAYCDVAGFCPKGKLIKQLDSELKEKEDGIVI